MDEAAGTDHDLLTPELLAGAVAGEPRAVAALLAAVQPPVLRFCRARLGPRETAVGCADDVAQDVCAAVLSVLPTYRLTAPSFRAFVFGIARHKVADAFRAMTRNRCDAVEELPERCDPQDDPALAALDVERSERLGDLLGVLSPRQAEILALRVAVGLTAEETADALGTTSGAVRVAQHRALQRLRQELTERDARRAADERADSDKRVTPEKQVPALRPPLPGPSHPGTAVSRGPRVASFPAVPAPRVPDELPVAL